MSSDREESRDTSNRCNVCGGGETDHHLCVSIESVLGGDVWVYDDGFARVVPWHSPDDRVTEAGR